MNNKLAAYRKLLKISQTKMAEIAQISTTSYNRKELGKVDFTQSQIIKIADFIKERIPGVTIDEIFFDNKCSKLLNDK